MLCHTYSATCFFQSTSVFSELYDYACVYYIPFNCLVVHYINTHILFTHFPVRHQVTSILFFFFSIVHYSATSIVAHVPWCTWASISLRFVSGSQTVHLQGAHVSNLTTHTNWPLCQWRLPFSISYTWYFQTSSCCLSKNF